jgi:SWI/SNF-related matrix-associated actin-dependent regulator of chromatin subfamily A containing DEAD/H box 1
LLSTKAGGVGINLTSADTVIFYDISFNPQVEKQAEGTDYLERCSEVFIRKITNDDFYTKDRCHRLGQEKEVTIYRLITKDSVDENMLSLAQGKEQLNDTVLEEVC